MATRRLPARVLTLAAIRAGTDRGLQPCDRSAGLQPILCTNVGNLEAMQALALRWSASKDRPTAAFSLKRISSVYLIQALHLHKLRIPEDIAVVGFDDFELAEVLGTPLTVVRQTPTRMARAAAELLFKKITNLREEAAS